MANEWEKKFKRDGPLMPFGSMCNAFGQIHHGKGMDTKTFLKAMRAIKNQAIKIVDELIKGSQEPEQPKPVPQYLKKAFQQDAIDDEANKQFDAASEQENESV